MSVRSLLPVRVAVAETTDVERAVELHDEEGRYVARAVEARRNEFALGRKLAREALSTIGVAPGPIGVGDDREPLWPVGVVGSITHCDGYAAAAVARSGAGRSLGIDVEPKLPLPDGVTDQIVSDDEAAEAAQIGPFGDRLIFSAKESIYKAWFPIARRWLGFHDCHLAIAAVDESHGSFVGTVAPAVLNDGGGIPLFHGRYVLTDGHIMTAVLVPALD